MRPKLTLDVVRQRLLDKNFDLLSDYVNDITKIQVKCPYCKSVFSCRASHIFNGNIKSCGCYRKNRLIKHNKSLFKDITGQRFNKFLVLEYKGRDKRQQGRWLCRCDCGKEKIITYCNLLYVFGCGNCLNYINSKRCSKQQIKIKELLGHGVLNFKSGKYFIDIALIFNGDKICVEYDSWYWHNKCKEKDAKKVKFLLENGWKCLIIKANEKIPTKEVLREYLLKLSNTNYIELILEDWRNEQLT